MTPFEHLKKDCPGLNEEALNHIVRGMCPYEFGYRILNDGICYGDYESCHACWNDKQDITEKTEFTEDDAIKFWGEDDSNG